jgi:hypothetical protein
LGDEAVEMFTRRLHTGGVGRGMLAYALKYQPSMEQVIRSSLNHWL